MTNFEKYKDEILEIVNSGSNIALDIDGNKVIACKNLSCENCEFQDEPDCTQSFVKWLYEEYEEPPIDWSTVAVDTKILVSKDGNHWSKRYFAKRKGGRFYTWYQGATSWSTDRMEAWDYAKLAEEDAE